MKPKLIIDWIVTPFLTLATALILVLAGCQGEATDESSTAETTQNAGQSAEMGHGPMPDPAVPQGENLERPEGWVVRLDRPDASAVIGSADTADIFFVNMTPGWHVTTHKSAIFYHPASKAEGEYSASASIYFFDPGERDREGYGIIFGGTGLDGEDQAYGYFLARNTGEFLIKRRSGDETSVVQDWASSHAVKVFDAEGGDSVLNEFSVHVQGDQVHFALNGENVATHPTGSVPTDGIFGLRLNHGVNVHVAKLSVER